MLTALLTSHHRARVEVQRLDSEVIDLRMANELGPKIKYPFSPVGEKVAESRMRGPELI